MASTGSVRLDCCALTPSENSRLRLSAETMAFTAILRILAGPVEMIPAGFEMLLACDAGNNIEHLAWLSIRPVCAGRGGVTDLEGSGGRGGRAGSPPQTPVLTAVVTSSAIVNHAQLFALQPSRNVRLTPMPIFLGSGHHSRR